MKSIAAVIIARMNSTRFPGKVLEEIQGVPLLECILARLSRDGLGNFEPVLATSTHTCDDYLVSIASKLKIKVFRGPSEDVMRRFIEAAEFSGAHYAARINGDSPLLEPQLLKEAGDALKHMAPAFVTSKPNPNLPYGVAAEVARVAFLRDLHRVATTLEREHVTAAAYQDPHIESVVRIGSALPARPDLSLAVDTVDDLARVNRLVERSGKSISEVAYWNLPIVHEKGNA